MAEEKKPILKPIYVVIIIIILFIIITGISLINITVLDPGPFTNITINLNIT